MKLKNILLGGALSLVFGQVVADDGEKQIREYAAMEGYVLTLTTDVCEHHKTPNMDKMLKTITQKIDPIEGEYLMVRGRGEGEQVAKKTFREMIGNDYSITIGEFCEWVDSRAEKAIPLL